MRGKKKCRIILGSSNLTKTGLFQNIEASLIIDFEKSDKKGEKLLSQIYDYFESFFKNEIKNLQIVTKELIQDLFDVGIIPDETERARTYRKETTSKKGTGKEDVLKKLKALFPSIEVQKAPKGFEMIRINKRKKVVTTTPDQDVWKYKGRLLWRKRLPATDVLYEKGGTNPTGCLRLTQAHWKVGGKTIDQTTYFRHDLFENFSWEEVRTSPFVEAIRVLFNVKILGEDKGQHRLEIRHKPSGEADQGNYTTSLSWGELGILIRDSNLRGKDFYLYAPSEGQREPFYIEFL